MMDKPNFVLIPDDAELPEPASAGGLVARLRAMATASVGAALPTAPGCAEPTAETGTPARPCLVLAVEAAASREPAWATARHVTDALVKALP